MQLINDISLMQEYNDFNDWVKQDSKSYDHIHRYYAEVKKLSEILQVLLNNDGIIKPKHFTSQLLKELIINLCTIYQERFQMDDKCSPSYDKVIMYIREDPQFLKINPAYSFNKGLLISGKVGCGKTLLLQVTNDLLKYFKVISGYTERYSKTFYTKSANIIVQDFSRYGYEIMNSFNPYCDDKDYGLISNNLFIDDLGTESIGSHFGNQENVIGQLLQMRYDNRNKYITHATSNLDSKTLKAKYGERVFSRINEMFNYIYMEGDDRRT